MTFTQLTARLKNFLMGWLLVLGLTEGLVECATVCLKSEVILTVTWVYNKSKLEYECLTSKCPLEFTVHEKSPSREHLCGLHRHLSRGDWVKEFIKVTYII